jgi:hypothetical protein
LGSFTDRLLVQLRDPAQVVALLAPAADAAHARLRALLEAVYDQPFAIVHDVRNPQLRSVEFERPVVVPRRRRGTHMQTSPSYTRTEIQYEDPDTSDPVWVDVVVELDVDVLVEVDPSQIESVSVREIEGYETLDEFKAKFQFLDLDSFLARLGIKTVQELKARYQTLLAEFRMKPAPPFDPNDPANLKRYPLKVALLVREALDVAGLLREAKWARRALGRAFVHPERGFNDAEVRSTYAAVVVLPDAALNNQPITAVGLAAFLALARVNVVFTTPV